MKAEMVYRYVGQRLARLQALSEQPRKAMLAKLRRGVGGIPGDIPELWGAFLQDLPLALQSRNGQATHAEWAIYLALTLYALHQQGHALPEENMNRTGQPFGTAIRRLSASNEDPEESSIFRRFNALATATDITEIAQHLRGIIQLLRSNGIPLDYPKLAEDLYGLQSPATASRIRLRWGQEYYYTPPKEESDASAHPEKEKRDE